MYAVNGKPVIAYAIEPFEKCKMVNEIIIVAQEDSFERINAMCIKYGFHKVSKIMKGGQTRLESVINGVYAASGKARLIAIHDGARPFLDIDILEKTIQKAATHNAAAPAVAITSTIKRVNSDIIAETVDRDGLFEIQTPQIFRAEIIKAALTNAMKKAIDITDDCSAVEIIGVPVYIVEGSRRNIKITDTEDLLIAEALLKSIHNADEETE